MKFEHLIEINNFEDPRSDKLNREQLWQGLLLRAKKPTLFIPHMDAYEITQESENTLTRLLDFGKFKVKDKVEMIPMQKLLFHIPSQGDIMESRLEISISEPFSNHFFVRFIYEDASLDEGANAMYNDFRRSAYKEMDIDSIRIIRQLVAQGKLDATDTENKNPLS